MGIKETVLKLGSMMSQVPGDSLGNILLFLAKSSEAHWKKEADRLTPGSTEHSAASSAWCKARVHKRKINEAMEVKSVFDRALLDSSEAA